jgi:hypothetical protein
MQFLELVHSVLRYKCRASRLCSSMLARLPSSGVRTRVPTSLPQMLLRASSCVAMPHMTAAASMRPCMRLARSAPALANRRCAGPLKRVWLVARKPTAADTNYAPSA